jgi:AbrB family looped-hinge helix DNA binding protein
MAQNVILISILAALEFLVESTLGLGEVTVAKFCAKVILPISEVLPMATNVTRKGQVTVPKPVRDYLGLKPGVGVIFERLASGDIVLRAAKPNAGRKASPFARLRGRADARA